MFLKYYGLWTIMAVAETFCLVKYCASHEAQEEWLNRAMTGLIPFAICSIVSTIFMFILEL